MTNISIDNQSNNTEEVDDVNIIDINKKNNKMDMSEDNIIEISDEDKDDSDLVDKDSNIVKSRKFDDSGSKDDYEKEESENKNKNDIH